MNIAASYALLAVWQPECRKLLQPAIIWNTTIWFDYGGGWGPRMWKKKCNWPADDIRVSVAGSCNIAHKHSTSMLADGMWVKQNVQSRNSTPTPHPPSCHLEVLITLTHYLTLYIGENIMIDSNQKSTVRKKKVSLIAHFFCTHCTSFCTICVFFRFTYIQHHSAGEEAAEVRDQTHA